jgi:hypothetical protein
MQRSPAQPGGDDIVVMLAAGPALAFGLIASGEARADAVILSCWGTSRLVPTVPVGKQAIEEKDESHSVSITVDIANKTLTINDDEPWPIKGDTSGTVILSIGEDKGSATLNRITGSVAFHTFGNRGDAARSCRHHARHRPLQRGSRGGGDRSGHRASTSGLVAGEIVDHFGYSAAFVTLGSPPWRRSRPSFSVCPRRRATAKNPRYPLQASRAVLNHRTKVIGMLGYLLACPSADMATEPPQGMLMLVCAATRGEISTGAVYTQEDLARTRRAKVHSYCPFCGEAHVFNFSDARLRPILH